MHLKTLVIATLLSVSAFAHQPILDKGKLANTQEEPYVIEKPEISKAVYSELTGRDHYYRIDSDTDFAFYAGITVAKVDDCRLQTVFSYEVLDADFNVIDQRSGEDFEWWAWYEEFGKKWYWVGPEIGKDFASDRTYDAGTYYIRVFNKDNQGPYVLVVGDIEKFTLPVIARTLVTLPTINNKYWDDVVCTE
jgi:hypothetical protein